MNPKPQSTIRPSVILLNSYPGIGKLTTAKALCAAISPSPTLIDNHKWLDCAYILHPHRKHMEYVRIGNEFRRLFISNLKEIPNRFASIVMTNVIAMESPNDLQAFAEQVDVARVRGCKFVLVTLICNSEENGSRVGSRDIGTTSKLKDPAVLGMLRESFTILDPESSIVKDMVKDVNFEHIEIDTTGKTVEDSVAIILESVKLY